MNPSPRAQIRREIRSQRRALSATKHAQYSAQLCHRISRSPLFQRSHHIALYLPNDGEVDLRPLIHYATDRGKRCYLPVLSPIFHNRLWFAPYNLGDPLESNRFGIPEPSLNWRAMRPAWSLDLLLMPLVAFDNAGNRLGMGGGYYDRTLAYLRQRHHWRKPHLLGTAFELQRIDTLPHEAWDIPLQAIATENRIYLAHQV